MTTYVYEIRWSPESYWVGVRVSSLELAKAVIDEIKRQHPRADLENVLIERVEVISNPIANAAELARQAVNGLNSFWHEMGFCDNCPIGEDDHTKDEDEDEPEERRADPGYTGQRDPTGERAALDSVARGL